MAPELLDKIVQPRLDEKAKKEAEKAKAELEERRQELLSSVWNTCESVMPDSQPEPDGIIRQGVTFRYKGEPVMVTIKRQPFGYAQIASRRNQERFEVHFNGVRDHSEIVRHRSGYFKMYSVSRTPFAETEVQTEAVLDFKNSMDVMQQSIAGDSAILFCP